MSVLICGLSPFAQAADHKCTLDRAASVPMARDSGGLPVITVSMNDQPARLLIDTGGVVSLISEGRVKALGLTKTPVSPGRLIVAGGASISASVNVDTLKVGRLIAKQPVFYMVPDWDLPPGDAGSFGADFLRAWDVDFDFGAGRLNLFSPKHCRGKVVYWTAGNYVVRPFVLTSDSHIRLRVKLDGKPLLAVLDTGSSVSSMSLELAHRLYGVEVSALGASHTTPANGLKTWGRHNRAYTYPFKLLDLDGIAIKNPNIDIVPGLRLPSEEMIVGMSVLSGLHLYVAYRERKLYITAANAR